MATCHPVLKGQDHDEPHLGPAGPVEYISCHLRRYNSPFIKSNPSMGGTAYWATFRYSSLYAVCLQRSRQFINGLISELRGCAFRKARDVVNPTAMLHYPE